MGMPAEEAARKRMQVVVEYDGRKGRETKTFATSQAAKRFYTAKFQADKAPKVIGGSVDAEPAKASGRKAAKPKSGVTDKELIYVEWKKRRGAARRDWRTIRESAGAKAVKDSTVRSWVSAWNRGVEAALPRCAKQK